MWGLKPKRQSVNLILKEDQAHPRESPSTHKSVKIIQVKDKMRSHLGRKGTQPSATWHPDPRLGLSSDKDVSGIVDEIQKRCEG